jgi:probable rRNA maturation factor
LHGLLHLAGYDHEIDHGEMDALEARVRGRLGIAERRRASDASDGETRRVRPAREREGRRRPRR